MAKNILDCVDEVLDAVDRAVATGDFSGLSDEVKRQTRDFSSGAREFWNGNYNAGHTENRYSANNYRNNYRNGQRGNYGRDQYGRNGYNAGEPTYGQRGTYGGNRQTGQGTYGGNRQNGQGTYGGNRQNGQYGQGTYSGSRNGQYGQGTYSNRQRNTQTYSNAQGPSRQYQGGHMEKPAYARTAAESRMPQNEWLKEDEYFKAPAGQAAGIAQGVFGVGMAVIFGVTTLMGILFGLLGSGGFTLVAILGVLTAFFGVLGGMGFRKSKLIRHFISFRKKLKKNKYATTEELGEAAGISKDKAIAELKELTKDGCFKQGHFDEKETTFIATDELYMQYLNAEQGAAEARRVEAEKAKAEGSIPEEVKELLDRGNEYIAQIHKSNDAIPDALISGKLDRMADIVTKIFEEVRRRPELAGRLNMFMDYYLPTTTKLLTAYEELDRQVLAGDNITTAKREIAGSLDTINDAFEKLLDSFFAEQAMDVSADISVMKTMMQQDGLTPDEMEAYRRRQEAQQAQMETSETLDELQQEIDAAEDKPIQMTLGGEELGDDFVAPDEGEGEGIVLKF